MSNPINLLLEGASCVTIGHLDQAFLQTLGISRTECDIIMWADRLSHIEKHRSEFCGNFDEYVRDIPDIIKSPDYIGIHPTKNSIEFIKRKSDLINVVVRIKMTGTLAFRTLHPLTEQQLQSYLACGSVKKYNNSI